jgi:YegS/Rv2252/BmrU family lipid kinase
LIKPSTAVLIYNPNAGRLRRRTYSKLFTIQRELERIGFRPSVQPTAGPGDGTHLAGKAVQAGAELIIACGGDGTINEVACGMVHSQVPLSILPAGTANVLAREIGLPFELEAAVRMIPASKPRRLSLGRAGSRYFLLMAGVGFDAKVVRHVNGHAKKFLGMMTYVLQAAHQALFDAPVPFTISTEGAGYQGTFACISKSQHYGPIKIVREADLFSGQFYVYCFQSTNRFRYFSYGLAVLMGTASQLPDVCRFAATEIHCDLATPDSAPVFLQIDGEFAGQLPCVIKVVPDALTLLVPPGTNVPA